MKKSISDIDVRGKRVLMRVDFNVPQDANGRIADDRRIRMALPTINHILDNGGRLVLISHLGRPTGEGPQADARWTLAPIAKRLGELLGKSVVFAEDCVGPDAESTVAALKTGNAASSKTSASTMPSRSRTRRPRRTRSKDGKKTPSHRGWPYWPTFM